MADVASNSAAHDDDANAVVTRTRLVVAKHLAVMRIKSLLQVIAAASRAYDPMPRQHGWTRQGRNWFDWGFRGAPPRRHHGRGTCRQPATEPLILRERALPEDAAEQIGDVLGARLPQNAGAIAFDRPCAQMHAPGDLLVGQAGGEMLEHVALSRDQGFAAGQPALPAGAGLRELVDGGIDPVDDVAGAERLLEEVGRAAPDGIHR